MMIPTIDACLRRYEDANLSGRLNNEMCVPGPYLHAAKIKTRREGAILPDAEKCGDNRLIAQWEKSDSRVARDMSIDALYDVHMASALQKQRIFLPIFCGGELLFGRGDTAGLGPAISGGAAMSSVLRGYDHCSQLGLLGAIAEAAPMQAAAALERRSYNRAAAFCILAAVCGRSLLQPFRLCQATVIFALALTYAASTLVTAKVADTLLAILKLESQNHQPSGIFCLGLLVIGLSCLAHSRVYGPGEVALPIGSVLRVEAMPAADNNMVATRVKNVSGAATAKELTAGRQQDIA